MYIYIYIYKPWKKKRDQSKTIVDSKPENFTRQKPMLSLICHHFCHRFMGSYDKWDDKNLHSHSPKQLVGGLNPFEKY